MCEIKSQTNILKNASKYGYKGFDVVVSFNKNAGESIKILQLTDMQIIDSFQRRTHDRLCPDEINSWQPDMFDENISNHIKALVAQTNPDMIFITGDLVYGSFDDRGTTFIRFCELMNSFEIPWAPVFGNHDNESEMGVDWQCEVLECGKYCLFTKGHVSGNGNYTVGIAVNGKIIRVMHMLDSHGCLSEAGLYDDQLEMVRRNNSLINMGESKIPSFFAFHYPTDEFRIAEKEKGYFTEEKRNYIIGVDVPAQHCDFGAHIENFKKATPITVQGFSELLEECNADGVFVGHFHSINTCIEYNGVKWVHGLKTGQYDYHNPGQLGGTLITITKDYFNVMHIAALVKYSPFPGDSIIFKDFFAKHTHIRKLDADELVILTALHDYDDVEDMLASNRRRIENGEIDIFCMFDGEKPVGELRVMYKHEDSLFTTDGKRVYLYAFRIHTDFQGQGLGKYLMNYVIDTLEKLGYTEFTIGVEDDNTIAQHIYQSLGFTELLTRKKEEYQGDSYEYNLYLKR